MSLTLKKIVFFFFVWGYLSLRDDEDRYVVVPMQEGAVNWEQVKANKRCKV